MRTSGSVRAAQPPLPSRVQAAAQREQASLVMGEAGVLAQYDHGVMPALVMLLAAAVEPATAIIPQPGEGS